MCVWSWDDTGHIKMQQESQRKNMNIASRFQIMWELCSSIDCMYLWSFLGFLSMHLCVLIAMVVWACSQKNTNQTTIIAHNITRTFLAQMADLELIKRSRFDLLANRDRKLNALRWSHAIVTVDVFFFSAFVEPFKCWNMGYNQRPTCQSSELLISNLCKVQKKNVAI